MDLKKLSQEIVSNLKKQQDQLPNKKLLRRLRLVHSLMLAKIRPEWMLFTVLPVLPPDIRPMVQLDGGRFASSDLNDLYRRVINRNNRLKRLIELKAPEVIIRNEKRMLQEAVDALIDNSSRRGKGAQSSLGAQRRPLKSLADMLKGKQGRFRQNLLGKRVDYSGRSVIVIGPELSLNKCGIPKKMALEIFKPFVIRELLNREILHNVRGASRLIEDAPPEVWGILEEVIRDKYVLLNRAPTLHRLSVQAFQPALIEGLAIQIPAMVCQAFNADFDGDQMAVHLPLTEEAQAEAEALMVPGRNLLKPATGDPIVVPTQDVVLGLYWLTRELPARVERAAKVFSSPTEALLAYENGWIELREKILVLIFQNGKAKKPETAETTAGRLIFNEILPDGFSFVNQHMTKKSLRELVAKIADRFGSERANQVLDDMKDLGFEYAARSGISWGMDDLTVPAEKKEIVERASREITTIQNQYQEGLLTNDERRRRVIAIWRRANDELAELIPKRLDQRGSVYSIINSGARGTWTQPVQMAGMKGLVNNPAGETIELPVLSSFKEGFNVLEYFISTHGARKGSTDTALRTASAGYLTRRLVDVAQDVVIREVDCKTKGYIVVKKADCKEYGESFAERIAGRAAIDTIKLGRKIIAEPGDFIAIQDALRAEEHPGIKDVKIRAVLRCRSKFGICQKCYGFDLGYNQPVKIGEAVGIVAAQAIGEPGTQLTMRTFHTGGVASVVDITQGLPRVEEIFEARPPRGKAPIAENDGKVVDIVDQGKLRIIKILDDPAANAKTTKKKSRAKSIQGKRFAEYAVSAGATLWVKEGDDVKKGQQLTEGNLDLKELLRISGVEAAERYVLQEVKKIYQTHTGEAVNDKHIEIIVRQMFSRVRIKEKGDSRFVVGDVVDKSRFFETNERLRKSKKKPSRAVQLVMGITKVALSTESFLSAASFQETARVLVQAALEARVDELKGLKENVIIGKLIPAGTGFRGPILRSQENSE
jgi:DNA-directed RNA polymerase subunit beta'